MTAYRLRFATLILGLLLHAAPTMAQPAGTSERTIRATRAASNAALAAGDLDAFLASIDADYVGTAGNGGHIHSRSELAELIGSIFVDAPGLHFVRTPDQIQVSDDDQRAIETGRWVQVNPGDDPAAPGGIGGRYTAYWRRGGAGWGIHAEVFVTLSSGRGG